MSNERYDNIEYNDEWQSVPVVRATPVEAEYDYDEIDRENSIDVEDCSTEEYPQFFELKKRREDNVNPQPVIKFQFFMAILVLAGAFLLKGFGGNIYTSAKDWYFENLNNSLVITMQNSTEPYTTEPATEQEATVGFSIEQDETEQVATEVQDITEGNYTESLPQD